MLFNYYHQDNIKLFTYTSYIGTYSCIYVNNKHIILNNITDIITGHTYMIQLSALEEMYMTMQIGAIIYFNFNILKYLDLVDQVITIDLDDYNVTFFTLPPEVLLALKN